MIHADADRLATLALPYFDDISDENELMEYIDDFLQEFPEDVTLVNRLAAALDADLHDLLHNANDEDLNWTEADTASLHEDEGYYANLSFVAQLLASKITSRIYN